MKKEIFDSVLNKFETSELRLYCEDMLELVEDYIFKIPSSTSYKYHNATQCKPGGQLYHILMVGTIMNHMLDLQYLQERFNNPKQRDCMRIAALLHDMKKTGGGQYTVHEHPVLAQEWIINTVVEHDIDPELKKYIGRLVASHSGQWTTSNRSTLVLPSADTDDRFLVHLADYLGSRSDIDMIYSQEQNAGVSAFQKEAESPMDYVMPFGKHKGSKLKDVPINYLQWLKDNTTMREPMKGYVERILDDDLYV